MSNSRPSSGYSALPPPAHSLHSYTPSACALPLVPLPLVLDIALDLTLVKSTFDPYLSSSDLVPFTSLSLLFLCHPCNTSSPFLLPLWFIFLPLLYFLVPGLFSCLLLLHPLCRLRCLLVLSGVISASHLTSSQASTWVKPPQVSHVPLTI